MKIRSKNRIFKLNVYEERIIRVMRAFYDSMTINEIAEESGIHWKTTARHLKKLTRLKLIKKIKSGEKVHWKAIRP